MAWKTKLGFTGKERIKNLSPEQIKAHPKYFDQKIIDLMEPDKKEILNNVQAQA